MNNIIVLENYVDPQCVRQVHLMSNTPPCPPHVGAITAYGEGTWTKEAGVWHFRALHPYRGLLDVACVQNEKKFRRLVVWSLAGYTSMQPALFDAWKEYCVLFGGKPVYAFVRKLPRGVENGHDVGMMCLMQADWMLEKCVAVGGKQ